MRNHIYLGYAFCITQPDTSTARPPTTMRRAVRRRSANSPTTRRKSTTTMGRRPRTRAPVCNSSRHSSSSSRRGRRRSRTRTATAPISTRWPRTVRPAAARTRRPDAVRCCRRSSCSTPSVRDSSMPRQRPTKPPSLPSPSIRQRSISSSNSSTSSIPSNRVSSFGKSNIQMGRSRFQ